MYSKEQIDGYVDWLVEERRKFTDEIAKEGLKPEILREAEKSFRIQPKKKMVVAVPKVKGKEEPTKEAKPEEMTQTIPVIPDWETKS